MAIIKVQGTVTRIFFDGKGAEVTESWKSKDETLTKRWSVFFEELHGLLEGDVVEVSGMHGDKIDTWDDKQSGQPRSAVKRTINQARLATNGTAAVTSAQPSDANPVQGTDTSFNVAEPLDGRQGNWDSSDYDEGIPF